MSSVSARSDLHANWLALVPLLACHPVAYEIYERLFAAAQGLLHHHLRSNTKDSPEEQQARNELSQAMGELHAALAADGPLPEGPLTSALAATPPCTGTMLELLLALFENRQR